jgi:ABC-type polysaccharide/polyol phosphate export permease
VLEWGNPVAPFVTAVRDVLFLGTAPSAVHLAYLVVAAGVALGAGVLLFRRLERDLAAIL